MLEVIIPAIGTGILLSLVLIGPVFFLLIETSLTKGHRAAMVLDLGVIIADILCICVAYYGSQDLEGYINSHPALYRIGGFIIIIYGLFMILSKGNPRINVLYVPLYKTPAEALVSEYLKAHKAPFPAGSIASGASTE